MASTFTKIIPPVVPQPDPHKYVNYTLGMLLGVDDFTQEHAYLSGYDHWLTRELLGYGTVSGLHISSDVDGERGPRVLVDPGVAISPRGQLIRVAPAQCAYINEWLAANRFQLGDAPHNPLTLYVVLRYRACASDTIPISGEPGRSEDSLMAPSRLSDDSTLELRLASPNKREEEALRAFIAWLKQVRIADPQTTNKDTFTTPEQFAYAIQQAAQGFDLASPVTLMTGSPPTDLLIPADKACEYWQMAFGIWTTQIRPQWRAVCSSGDVPDEDSLLLAKLRMRIAKSQATGDWRIRQHKNANPVHVDESDRPRLLHLQLLQEWMLCGRNEIPPSDFVSEATSFGQKPHPGTMTSYSRADHSHGTPENILYSLSVILAGYSRTDHDHKPLELKGDAVSTREGTVSVQGLHQTPIDPRVPTEGQVLMYSGERWQATSLPEAVELKGDAVSTRDGSVIVKSFHQTPIDPTPPVKDQILMYSGERWQPSSLPEPVGLKGDAVSTREGTVSVQGLHQIPIDPRVPTEDQVLMYSGERWQPTSLPEPAPAVERPAGLGRYSIVAAGYVKCDGTGQETSYNRLNARAYPNGAVRVRFTGYSNVHIDKNPYVVKVLPNAAKGPCIVHFDHFTREYFVLYVTDSNGEAIKENLEDLWLMIEVSQYEILTS